jgi:cytochrome c-type biogenesis protein CcmH/NrfG
VEPFKRITQSRYPWISDNAIKVIINKAQMEMMRVRDEETNGREYSKTLAEKGKLDDAIAHLKLRLELNPNDAKAWYDLGELLFKKGDAKGGFDAFKKGDELYKKR